MRASQTFDYINSDYSENRENVFRVLYKKRKKYGVILVCGCTTMHVQQ